MSPRKESGRRYAPTVFGLIIAVAFVLLALILPPKLFGPALPSTIEMWVVMFAIIVIGIAVIIFSAVKVLRKLPATNAHAISFMIGGLILFVAVTIFDIPIHTTFIEFNQLTHTLWHVTELVGIVLIGTGLYKLSKVSA